MTQAAVHQPSEPVRLGPSLISRDFAAARPGNVEDDDSEAAARIQRHMADFLPPGEDLLPGWFGADSDLQAMQQQQLQYQQHYQQHEETAARPPEDIRTSQPLHSDSAEELLALASAASHGLVGVDALSNLLSSDLTLSTSAPGAFSRLAVANSSEGPSPLLASMHHEAAASADNLRALGLTEEDVFSACGGLEIGQDVDGMHQSALASLFGVQLAPPPPMASKAGGMPGAAAQAASVGEHPFGEHPSRTLFVRNINWSVEETELRALFESYGEIRAIYSACKHRGFVMISYYDLRSAKAAMRALQGKIVRRRRLDIHYSIPKDNPNERDINQGTLVVFNLDSAVTNEQLYQLFTSCGEVKEIRETPKKKNHKFVEYFDIRAAGTAMQCLNHAELCGKRIKLEPSRPGGSRRSTVLASPQRVLAEDERRSMLHSANHLWNIPTARGTSGAVPMQRPPQSDTSRNYGPVGYSAPANPTPLQMGSSSFPGGNFANSSQQHLQQQQQQHEAVAAAVDGLSASLQQQAAQLQFQATNAGLSSAQQAQAHGQAQALGGLSQSLRQFSEAAAAQNMDPGAAAAAVAMLEALGRTPGSMSSFEHSGVLAQASPQSQGLPSSSSGGSGSNLSLLADGSGHGSTNVSVLSASLALQQQLSAQQAAATAAAGMVSSGMLAHSQPQILPQVPSGHQIPASLPLSRSTDHLQHRSHGIPINMNQGGSHQRSSYHRSSSPGSSHMEPMSAPSMWGPPELGTSPGGRQYARGLALSPGSGTWSTSDLLSQAADGMQPSGWSGDQFSIQSSPSMDYGFLGSMEHHMPGSHHPQQHNLWPSAAQRNPPNLTPASSAADLMAMHQQQHQMGVGAILAQSAANIQALQQLQASGLLPPGSLDGALVQGLLAQQLAEQGIHMPSSIHPVPAMDVHNMPQGDRGASGRPSPNTQARRPMDSMADAHRKAQQQQMFSLDLRRVARGEDSRTTLMIKNIPNKYTQKMLLSAIDELFQGSYDFFYLPIDFKNKCNMGYAFINMVAPHHILPLVERFNNRKWEKFNSEKVACITYARIQGKISLIAHFQNSSLMHEDKHCRPIIFASDGIKAGEQEPFPVGPYVRSRAGRGRDRTKGSMNNLQAHGGGSSSAADLSTSV